MERNLSFPGESVARVRTKLTWAQIEVVSGDTNAFHLIIAGDEESVGELRVELSGEDLVVGQPQLAYAKEILPRRRWLQICLCVPVDWKAELDIGTLSGSIGAHGLTGEDISLTTVSGPIHARGIESSHFALHTVAGSISGEALRASHVYIRTVSGKVVVTDALFTTAKLFTLSGEVKLALKEGSKTLDLQSISAPLCVEAIGPVRASMHSLSGQFLLDEELTPSEKENTANVLEITASSVTGDMAVKKWEVNG